jgi:hypothetical protein
MLFRCLLFLTSLLVLGLGLGCLNYTDAWQLNEHTRWASDLGLPAPSPMMHRFGMGATAVGGAFIGLLLRKKR